MPRETRSETILRRLVRAEYDSVFTVDTKTGISTSFMSGEARLTATVLGTVGESLEAVVESLRAYCTPDDAKRALREINLESIQEHLGHMPLYETYYTLTHEGIEARKRLSFTYLDDSKDTLLCGIKDQTEASEQEEFNKRQLEAALRSAQRANGAKTDFLSNMSHEIRTPMNAIIGMTRLAKDTRGNPPETSHYLDQIENSGHHLLGLVNDILDMNRIESGRFEIHRDWVLVSELFAACVDMMKPVMIDNRIDFIYSDMTESDDMELYVDSLRLKQVIMNLLGNAAKFTPQGGTVTTTMERVSIDDARMVCFLRVSDTGCGMSEEFLDHLFEPFAQEHAPLATRDIEGTGLGLTLVKRILDASSDTIEVKSEYGKGTTFLVTLTSPYRYVDTDREPKTTNRPPMLSNRRVLLVEDQALNRDIAENLLAKQGMIVDVARNGQEAVDAFKKSTRFYYDAILMDIRMPVMDGLDATRAIRALKKRSDAKRVPIIAMTANAFDDDVRASLSAGMNAHLAKPIEPEMLYRTLERNIMIFNSYQ